jgi:hypothetical protein
MSVKKMLSIGLLAISFSTASHAVLNIMNNSNKDSTAIINGGMCSSAALGDSGITKAHSPNTISDFVIWYTCRATPHDCKADVYMTKDCYASGASKVATVVFDTQIGIKSISSFSDEFIVSGSAFSMQINDGVTFANND